MGKHTVETSWKGHEIRSFDCVCDTIVADLDENFSISNLGKSLARSDDPPIVKEKGPVKVLPVQSSERHPTEDHCSHRQDLFLRESTWKLRVPEAIISFDGSVRSIK